MCGTVGTSAGHQALTALIRIFWRLALARGHAGTLERGN